MELLSHLIRFLRGGIRPSEGLGGSGIRRAGFFIRGTDSRFGFVQLFLRLLRVLVYFVELGIHWVYRFRHVFLLSAST